VRPSNHYHMGGIPTNEFGEVRNISQDLIPGLFAVGECASASFHGFNRLGTNSILELITMGKFVGDRVIEYLKNETSLPPEAESNTTFSRFASYLDAKREDNIGKIRKSMRSLMTDKVGVFRTGEGISQAVEDLKALKARADETRLNCGDLKMNQELVQRWELDNLLSVAMIIATAALAREESRGAHYRDDFPERSDAFNYHTLTSMEQFGDVRLERREVDMSVFDAGGEHSEKFNIMERKY
jgi:succinate dehydrogenase / fumarate reductase, flavoprotein subunit